jgi:hypothetical protein
MVNRTVVGGLALVLLAGCASTSQGSGTESATSSGSAGSVAANGTLVTSLWDTAAGTRTITSHPIGTDGSIGAEAPLLSGPADDTTFPGVVDGVGPAVLTGTFTDYWTTDLQVRAAGEVSAEVAAPRWCGGEGLAYNPCILLDDTRLARTTELGREPESGGGPTQASIIVSSLADGSTLAEFPVTDLTMMLATTSPDQVLIVTAPAPSAEDPSTPSTIMRMDLTDGTTSELGVSPAGWVPLCPIGDDSVLGFPGQDLTGSAVVVGPAQVADVTWDQQDTLVGCSADGRYLYVQRIPQPPTGEVEDTEPPNPSTALERITLADGSRTPVLTLAPGWTAGPVTR